MKIIGESPGEARRDSRATRLLPKGEQSGKILNGRWLLDSGIRAGRPAFSWKRTTQISSSLRFPVKSVCRDMAIAKRLTIDNVNLDNEPEMDAFDDQVLTGGIEQVRAEGDELRRRGLIDGHGNLLLNELPADMKEDSERDFGG